MALDDFKVLQGLAIEDGSAVGQIKVYAGSPEGNVTAVVGSLCMDTSAGALYKKTSGSGNTGWSEVSSTAAINALDWKQSVRAAGSADVDLSTLIDGATFGGVTLAEGDRILVKNNDPATENGVYVVQATNPPVRAADFDDPNVSGGAAVAVEEGTYADQIWIITNDGAVDVGTDAITFASVGVYTAGTNISIVDGVINNTISAGDGIDLTGGVISVDLLSTGGLEVVGTSGSAELAINVDATTKSTEINAANELAVRGYAKKITTGTGSAAVVDSVLTAEVVAAKWLVSVKNSTTGAYYAEVSAVTEGSTVDYNVSSVLKTGTITKPNISVVFGTAAMDLTIAATAGYTIQITRIANLIA